MTQRIKNDFLFGVCLCEWKFLFIQIIWNYKKYLIICCTNQTKKNSNSFLRLQLNSKWRLGLMVFLCVSTREIWELNFLPYSKCIKIKLQLNLKKTRNDSWYYQSFCFNFCKHQLHHFVLEFYAKDKDKEWHFMIWKKSI